MSMDPKALSELVRSIVLEVVREVEGTSETKSPPPAKPRADDGAAARGPAHRPLQPWRSREAVQRLKASTPARIVTGRTGLRYLTENYLGLREDHAIALDAVESQVPEGWAEQQGWLPLRTQSKDHQEYLLHPETGRKLDDDSRRRCEAEADTGVDLQLIAGDGLSAAALLENGPPLVAALQRTLSAAGFRLGRPLFVQHARIGVQDDIGVLTQAKATVILVGERPGLGTGDSLSIYTAYGPKLGQDNAEKDCISNVRQLGFGPDRAAALCADLMQRTFRAQGGGVKLASSAAGSR